MKYIIFKKNNDPIEHPVIFPETIKHLEMAAQFMDYDVVGAGFVSISQEADENGESFTKFNCYGGSVSLNRISLDEDSQILTRLMNFKI
jgi:hypothetical protein